MEQMASNDDECPLCAMGGAARVLEAKALGRLRPFLHCPVCDLLYVPARFHLGADEEKKQYGKHRNDLKDRGYAEHLGAMARELNACATAGRLLDYGSGPVAAFADLMERAGWRADIYDPYFSPATSGLRSSYDFITCIEVAEHFRVPRRSWDDLFGRLAPGGRAFVMTQLRDFAPGLEEWYYLRDITHVAFYSRDCLRWIAGRWGLQVEFPSRQIACFKKNG